MTRTPHRLIVPVMETALEAWHFPKYNPSSSQPSLRRIHSEIVPCTQRFEHLDGN